MRKQNSLKRRSSVRLPRRKFVIFTEGKNTEPDYIRALHRGLPDALVDIQIIDAAGVPMTIARRAKEYISQKNQRGKSRSSFEKNDEIWAIFDRDDHPNIESALEILRVAKVETAFSDPCFELWLILHHTDFDRPDDRNKIQAHLQKLCPDYDAKKRKTTDCTILIKNLPEAEIRAEKQYKRRKEEGDPPSRPFTTMYKLTRSMRNAHESATR